MQVPVIDFAAYDGDRPETLSRLGMEVGEALTHVGFMSITNLGISPELRQEAFAASRAFFAGTDGAKMASAYRSASENFGYQGLGKEYLDPDKPSDLKETFTLRNALNHPPQDDRWPSAGFRGLMQEFYGACLEGAFRLQRVLATALGVEREFFVRHHHGENCTLRLLHYPDIGGDTVQENQLGAGEHTDYGLLTLLFQDKVSGLELLNRDNEWQLVEPVEGAILVNAGDLLERWTNGRYRSTLHRVQPMTGGQERFSIVMFVDPDSATPVEVLPSCLADGETARYAPITAGEHLLERIAASHHGNYEV